MDKDNQYFFVLGIKTGGLISSPYSLEETKELFLEDIAQLYGGAGELIEFRTPTEDELEAIPVVLELAVDNETEPKTLH